MTEKNILDQEVSKVTLRDLLDALGKESKERSELAGVLRDLNKAIDGMELNMHGSGDKMMSKLKDVREAFNRIPPKWFYP